MRPSGDIVNIRKSCCRKETVRCATILRDNLRMCKNMDVQSLATFLPLTV